MVLQAMGEAPAVATTALKEVRSAVTATTMEARLAAITASLNESLALLASSARRLGVKEQQGQEATKASVAPMTGTMYTKKYRPYARGLDVNLYLMQPS
jgi:hypothetical protein